MSDEKKDEPIHIVGAGGLYSGHALGFRQIEPVFFEPPDIDWSSILIELGGRSTVPHWSWESTGGPGRASSWDASAEKAASCVWKLWSADEEAVFALIRSWDEESEVLEATCGAIVQKGLGDGHLEFSVVLERASTWAKEGSPEGIRAMARLLVPVIEHIPSDELSRLGELAAEQAQEREKGSAGGLAHVMRVAFEARPVDCLEILIGWIGNGDRTFVTQLIEGSLQGAILRRDLGDPVYERIIALLRQIRFQLGHGKTPSAVTHVLKTAQNLKAGAPNPAKKRKGLRDWESGG